VGVKKDRDASMVSEMILKVKASGANLRKKIKLASAYCESGDYIPKCTVFAIESTLLHFGARQKMGKWGLKYVIQTSRLIEGPS
jgi:hypothetical protein